MFFDKFFKLFLRMQTWALANSLTEPFAPVTQADLLAQRLLQPEEIEHERDDQIAKQKDQEAGQIGAVGGPDDGETLLKRQPELRSLLLLLDLLRIPIPGHSLDVHIGYGPAVVARNRLSGLALSRFFAGCIGEISVRNGASGLPGTRFGGLMKLILFFSHKK